MGYGMIGFLGLILEARLMICRSSNRIQF